MLIAAGPAKGRPETLTIEPLRRRAGQVPDSQRYAVDGKLMTSAMVSAGIDMALWLVGQIHGPEHAGEVQRFPEYYPAPPYQ